MMGVECSGTVRAWEPGTGLSDPGGSLKLSTFSDSVGAGLPPLFSGMRTVSSQTHGKHFFHQLYE